MVNFWIEELSGGSENALRSFIVSMTFSMLGSLVTGFGMALFILLSVDFDLYYTIAVMATCGIGLAMFSAPNNSLIMSSVPGPLKGEASGMLAVVRQSGMMISMGVCQ